MNDPIKHHYSPQFYLRQWAGPDGRLFRYHRPHIETVVSPISPEYTGFEDYLYTVNSAADPQIIEKAFFSPVDSAAAPVLERFLDLGPGLVILPSNALTNQEKSDWVRFLTSLQHRGPHSLKEIKTVLDQSVRSTIELSLGEAYRASRTDGEPETAYELFLELYGKEHADAHKLMLPKLERTPIKLYHVRRRRS